MVPCVSYSPFRVVGQRPQDAGLRIPTEQIRSDLAKISEVSGCVRTYGVDHGLEALPSVAAGLGLQVVLGIWLDGSPARNRSQFERGLALANQHPSTIRLLMVGNEVLLRQEQTPEQLAAWLAEAQARTQTPVSYADVWEFWRRHAHVLAPHVDVASIHVLPYWEDDPVAVDMAVAHVFAKAELLVEALAPTPVWIAETGWPAHGRQRGPALPGTHQQQQFVQGLLQAAAHRPDLPINIIEAFDQPWKAAQEGAVGGAWGIFNSNNEARALGSAWIPIKMAFVRESHAQLSALQAMGLAFAAMLWVTPRRARWLLGLALMLGWLGSMAADLALLLTEGRYRSIPWGIASLGLGAVGWRCLLPKAQANLGMPYGTRMLALAFLGIALPLAWILLQQEGLQNLQLNLYLASALGAGVLLAVCPAKLRNKMPVRS